MALIDRIAGVLERRTSRRGFLANAAVVGSALSVGPLDYLLHPGTAYAFVCRCGNPACGCGSACCDGYTEFCCTLTGSNTCPPGTFAGGWWRADGSAYCSGPRYYIDCHGECPTQTGPGFCAGHDGLTCGCALGSCANRQAGCITFRYGQCHQEIATSGRIACRVVTCTPAYLVDNGCTPTVMVDDNTANHNRPCLQARPVVRRAYAAAVPKDGQGVWFAGRDGGVFTFGSAGFHGSMGGRPLDAPIVGMAGAPDGAGYWMVASDGGVFAFGSAGFHGSMGGQPLDALMAGVVASPTGGGYWLWGQDGGVFAFGDARALGSYRSLPPSEQTLPSAGVDAFYALAPGSSGGYTLWAAGSLGPPPSPASFAFG